MSTTALFRAVWSYKVSRLQRFLEDNPGVDVDALGYMGATSLLHAIVKKRKPIVKVLLAHGAAVNGPVGARKTPLQEACSLSNARSRSEFVSLLLEHGAGADAMTAECRRTPLSIVCNSDTNVGIIQLLLTAGADVNGGGGVIVPLHQAIYNQTTEAIDLLIQSGADVNILLSTNYYYYRGLQAGSTPLHFAANKKDWSCLNLLLEAGADPNIGDSTGQTPLHYAASVDAVPALLAAGAGPLHRDNRGRTPLQNHYYERRYMGFYEEECNVITALVAAGDRSWECVPTPCPGLEAAMLSVWQNAPDELPELVKRLGYNPPQTLIELFPRMDVEMKKVVQEVLRGLHHHFAGYPELKDQFMKSIFDFITV